MNMPSMRATCASTLFLALLGCASQPVTPLTSLSSPVAFKQTTHRQNDDLLTAGLGLPGLLTAGAPAPADPLAFTAQEQRQRAIWASWRGIADLMPGGGYGQLFGTLEPVPGREYSALVRLPDARQPHRVVVQVPDNFDVVKRCLVVAPSSGSRGVYGAIAVAAPWALPRGCAVAYTDKGAGSDYVDLDARMGIRADGSSAPLDSADDFAFVPEGSGLATGIAVKHAHSRDNPEARWGDYVRQAAEVALLALDQAMPKAAPFTPTNTRIIAVGVSNGGGAVLRAAEQAGDWLDAVVAGEPNIYVDHPDSRALYDYTTEAAILMPCALLALPDLPASPLTVPARGAGAQRCASLAAGNVISGADVAEQASDALAQLKATGWTERALVAGALSVDFDLWRSVAATYASAYGRYGVGEHPCGYAFAASNVDFSPRAATAAERASWLSDSSGIPPGNGVSLIDTQAQLPDVTRVGLQCLRELWAGKNVPAQRVQAGIAQTRADLPQAGIPVMIVHGSDDGLIPFAFTSAPYAAAAKSAGREVTLWQIDNIQHFDGFLMLPDYAARYLPLLPYVYKALDAVDARLDGKAALPADAHIRTTGRGAGKPLEAANLAMPE